MAPLHIEADGGEEDEKCYEDGEGDDSEDSFSSDGSESELDDDDLDEDCEDGEDDDFDNDDDDDDDDEEEEEEEEESGVSRRKRKRKNSTSSGDEGEEGDVGEEELCHKVVTMLRRRKNLNMLKLDECKAYLRKHGLRLTGSKSVCIQRVQDHWRLRVGNGEKLYPESSFMINCKGDVCTGDVILFKQRVYDKYDIVTRGGNIIGKRTVAGKVVKESYGAAKKQHTFTVEILWSKGVKPLPALHPLLVKGRNLYRLKTFRQRWDNEMERSKVLAEKHKRGTAARHARAIEKAKSVVRGRRHHQNSHARREPPTEKRQKVKQKTIAEAHKKHRSHNYNSSKPRTLESAASYSVDGCPRTGEVQRNYLLPQSVPSNAHCHPMAGFRHGGSRAAFHPSGGFLCSSAYEAGPSSPTSKEVYNQAFSRAGFFNRPYPNYHLPFGPNSLNLPLNQVHREETFGFPPVMHLEPWEEARPLRCQTPGCQELAANGCAISCCWVCCRRSGRLCARHA